MSVSKTQLTGGGFQDSEGNLLVNGYLKMTLSQDAEVNSTQICSGVEITIQLDSVGNVASSASSPSAADQYVWANDVLSPINTYYTVTAYTAAGQTAWGPNNQQVTSGGVGGSTFNTGTWVPNQIVWLPTASPVLAVEVAGTALSSATLLDFLNSGNVTFTDEGNGGVEANYSGGGIAAGTNIATLPSLNSTAYGSLSVFGTLNNGGQTNMMFIPAGNILSTASNFTVRLRVVAGQTLVITHFRLLRTLPNSLSVIDFTPITFGSTENATLSAGLNTSDAITKAIDPNHDYWFLMYTANQTYNGSLVSNVNYTNNGVTASMVMGGTIPGGVDMTALNPVCTGYGTTPYIAGTWLDMWQVG
jgi:hypothetical protein